MPLNIPSSMKRTLLHAGGGAAAGAALGGLTADPEHRMRGALQGGAIGGLAAGGASALASHSAGTRINALKGDVAHGAQQFATSQAAHASEQAAHAATRGEFEGLQQAYGTLQGDSARLALQHQEGQKALQGAHAQVQGLQGDVARLSKSKPQYGEWYMGPPSNVGLGYDKQHANTIVDNALQQAGIAHPPANPAITPSPGHQAWGSGPMAQVKSAMSPLGGAAAGAVTGGLIGGGSAALSGERDPKKLLRNTGIGAAMGGCAGFGIAHEAGACSHAQGMNEGYSRGVMSSNKLDDLLKTFNPLDVLRGQT